MLSRLNIPEYVNNLSIFIDQKGRSEYSIEFTAIVFFQTPHFIELTYFMFSICKQWERQPIFGFEFGVRFGCIRADTQDGDSCSGILAVIIPEITSFSRASWCIVLGIKI